MSGLVVGLSYWASIDQIRAALRLIPLEGLRRLINISDTMARRSKEIIDEKKAALSKGDEAFAHQVGEGKDIMSILRTSRVPTTHPPL